MMEFNQANKNSKNILLPISANGQTIIVISRDYIQDFVEANYGRKLTESELAQLSILVWEDGDYELMVWIDRALNRILKK